MDKQELDRHITGNYGADQYTPGEFEFSFNDDVFYAVPTYGGRTEIQDCEGWVMFGVVGEVSESVAIKLLQAYSAGRKTGEENGAASAQREMRKALGL